MKIVIAHPHRLIADAIAKTIEDSGEFEIDGTYTSSQDAVDAAGATYPDVVVISGAYADVASAETVRKLKESSESTAVLVISSGPGSEELLWVLKAGASGYVSLECTGSQLVEAVRKAAAGEIVLTGVDRNSLTASAEQKAYAASDASRSAAIGSLTPREREVLTLLSQGFSNRQIAEDLFLSEHTVRTHVQNLRAKLNVRSKFQAAVLAMQAGGQQPASVGGFSL